MPTQSRLSAKVCKAAMNLAPLIGRAKLTRMWATAAAIVPRSPKPSATSGTYPPRRADAASARPEGAAISTRPLSIEFVSKRERVAEIQTHGLCRFDHLLEQAKLGLVLDVTDRERPYSHGAMRINLAPICHHIEAFDAGRWNCVYVGDDEKVFRHVELRARQDLHAGAAGTQGNLAHRQDSDFLLFVTTIGRTNFDAESCFDFHGSVAHALDAVVADKRDISALQGRDDGGGKSHDAGCAEHRDADTFELPVFLFTQRLLNAGHHCGRSGKGACRIGEERNTELRHERLLGGLEHVQCDYRLPAPKEDACSDAYFRRSREDCVLYQTGYFRERDVGIRNGGVKTGIESHIHIEGAHMSERGQHMQDMLFSHIRLLARSQIRHRRNHANFHICAAIEPLASDDVQRFAARVVARESDQPLRFIKRAHKCKSSRAPRTLTDAERALAFQKLERRGDIGAGKWMAPLQRCKIRAENCLHLFDCRGKRIDIRFRKRR